MPRYVIIGAGALGATLAAQLHEHSVPYVIVARERQVALLRERGLTYVRPAGEVTLPIRVTTAAELGDLHSDDVLVFTPKTQDLDGTLATWAWHPVQGGGVAADLPVITVQNGLEADRQALRRFRTVLGASFNLPARHVEPGVVEVRSSPTIAVVTIGAYPSGRSETADQVAADWGRSGYAVQVTDDIVRWKAAKLLFNVNNAVDVFAGDPETIAELNAELAAEARTALTAAGFSIAEKSERTVDDSGFVISPHPEGRPGGKSTWQSFTRADASGHEVDFLNGEVVLLGRLAGVPTPLNEAVQRILGQSFARGEGPGAHDAREVLDAAVVPA